jgi:putative salt-induced outer membrane protein YdiY
MKLLRFCFLLLACGALFADQVTLKNGDTLTGQIVKKDGDTLTLKSEFLGEVTMPWSAITSVKSDNPLYVGLPEGKQLNGKITTEGSNVQVQTPSETAAAPLGQVNTIRDQAEQLKFEKLLHPTWFELWAGYVDVGFSLVRGNSHADTLTSAFNANRVTNNDKTTFFLNQIYATGTIGNVTGPTANAVRGGASYDHNLNSRLFVNFFTTDEYDNFQDLNFRFVGGAGLGFHAIKTDKTILDLIAGGNYTHESFGATAATAPFTRNLGEINVGDDFSHKITGVTSVTQSLRFYEAPSTGEYRFALDLGAATTIRKWLSWQVSASDRYLSNPVFGRKNNDILLSTGLRVSFAR